MWRVALSDGVGQVEEEAYLERAAERLGLDAEASAQARKDAELADPLSPS